FAVWTIPSPYPRSDRGLGAARLVSTPSRSAAPGLARDCHLTGFPEFEQFCIASFPASTQVWSESTASAGSATPASLFIYSCQSLSGQEISFRVARFGW